MKALFAITLLGALLRLGWSGIWRDEGSTFFDSSGPTPADVWQTVADCELNPPGYFLLIWVVLKVLGPWALHGPSWLASVLTIPATYRLTLEWSPGDQRAALVAAALIATSPEAIYFANEARPYSLMMLGVALCFQCRGWLQGLCLSLLLYVQYSAFLVIPGLWRNHRGVLVALLLFLPWSANFWSHLGTGTPWTQVLPWYQRWLLLPGSLQMLLPLAPGLGLVVLALSFRGSRPAPLHLALAGALLGVSALSISKNYTLAVQPLAACWLALGWQRGVKPLLALAAAIAVGLLVYHWPLPKSGVADALKKLPSGTLVLVAPDYLGPTAGYYAPHLTLQGFARWHQPQLFRPQDYLALWTDQSLVDTTMERLRSSRCRQIALLSPPLPLQDRGQLPYSRVNQLVERLQQVYQASPVQRFPARQEPVELRIFQWAEM